MRIITTALAYSLAIALLFMGVGQALADDTFQWGDRNWTNTTTDRFGNTTRQECFQWSDRNFTCN